jgi:hypothetical protein
MRHPPKRKSRTLNPRLKSLRMSLTRPRLKHLTRTFFPMLHFDKRPEWQALKTLPPAEAADKITARISEVDGIGERIAREGEILGASRDSLPTTQSLDRRRDGFQQRHASHRAVRERPGSKCADVGAAAGRCAKARGGLEISSADLRGKAEELQKLADRRHRSAMSRPGVKGTFYLKLKRREPRSCKLRTESKRQRGRQLTGRLRNSLRVVSTAT